HGPARLRPQQPAGRERGPDRRVRQPGNAGDLLLHRPRPDGLGPRQLPEGCDDRLVPGGEPAAKPASPRACFRTAGKAEDPTNPPSCGTVPQMAGFAGVLGWDREEAEVASAYRVSSVGDTGFEPVTSSV